MLDRVSINLRLALRGIMKRIYWSFFGGVSSCTDQDTWLYTLRWNIQKGHGDMSPNSIVDRDASHDS